MSVPEVKLTGTALQGCIPVAAVHFLKKTVAELPKTVKLGRLAAKADRKCVHFSPFFSPGAGAPIPEVVDWGAKAAQSIGRMYGNDRWGDCVWAEVFHQLGVWGGNDNDSGGEVIGTDEEVVTQYHQVCGPGDRGCVMADVQEYVVRSGCKAGGQTRQFDGFAELDKLDRDSIRVGIDLFGGVALGIGFRQAWQSTNTWGQTNSPVIGGHAVLAFGYDKDYVYLASWARVYRMPWAVATSRQYVDEAYVRLARGWYGNDMLAPCGIQVDPLKQALGVFAGGQTPPIPEPTPPRPPVPPAPPAGFPDFDFKGEIGPGGMITGLITPIGQGKPHALPADAEHHREVVFKFKNEYAAQAFMDMMFTVQGVNVTRKGNDVHVERGAVDPGNWAALLAFLLELAKLLIPIFA